MKKCIKICVILVGLLAGLLVLLSLGLTLFLDLNAYKDHIEKPIETALHREVKLGEMSHTLWRGPGIRIEDVSVAEKDQKGTFLNANHFTVRVKLLPLLSKRVEVAKIILNKPDITVTRDKEGGWNFDDLRKEKSSDTPPPRDDDTSETEETEDTDESDTPEQEPEPETPGSPSTPSPQPSSLSAPLSQFALDQFQLNNGTLKIVDKKTGVVTEITDIEAALSDVSLNSVINFTLSAALNGGKQGTFDLKGEAGPLPADGNVETMDIDLTATLEQIDVTHFKPYYHLSQEQADMLGNHTLNATMTVMGTPGDTLQTTGDIRISGLKSDLSGTVRHALATPEVDLVLDNVLDFDALLTDFSGVAAHYLPEELALGGGGRIRLTPSGTLNRLTLSGSVDLTDGNISFGEYFEKPASISSVVTFETVVHPDLLDISNVTVNLNDVNVTVTGKISQVNSNPQLTASVTSKPFDLNQLLLPFLAKQLKPSGSVELEAQIESPVKTPGPDAIQDGTIRLSNVGAELPQIPEPVRNLNALILLQGDQVRVKQFEVSVGESSLSGTATITQTFTSPELTFDLHAPRVNLDEFLPEPAQARMPADESPFQLAASTKTDLVESPKTPETPADETPQAPSDSPSPQGEPGLLPPNITVNGKVSVEQGQAKNVHFADLSADVTLDNRVLDVENILFNLYDGQYSGSVMLDGSTSAPRYAVQSELEHVDSNHVLTDTVSFADVLYGLLFANASLEGQGFEMEQIVKTLSGTGLIKVLEGKLATAALWTKLSRIFQQLGTLAQAKELTRLAEELARFSEGTPFSRLEGNFTLKQGSAGSSDLILELNDFDLHLALLLNGDFGLDTSLDFIGKLRVAPESKYYDDVKKYFGAFKRPGGSIDLPFPIPIGGTLLKPEFSMQTVQNSVKKFAAELAKEAVKSTVEEEGKKLLEQEGKKLLDSLFK